MALMLSDMHCICVCVVGLIAGFQARMGAYSFKPNRALSKFACSQSQFLDNMLCVFLTRLLHRVINLINLFTISIFDCRFGGDVRLISLTRIYPRDSIFRLAQYAQPASLALACIKQLCSNRGRQGLVSDEIFLSPCVC